jgi:murein DD-endopeptidase MepM/ murein hydrolase activator NlpD
MIIYRAMNFCWIGQKFGLENTASSLLSFYQSIGLKGHNGWDFGTKDAEPIYWDTDGRGMVIETSIDCYGGLGVVVNSEDNGKFYKHRFWHLKEFKCHTGQILEGGDLIGLADNTGKSTGPHLHRDLKECDKNYNTLNKDNGYGGCLDIQLFWKNVFIKDYMAQLKGQVSILRQMLEIIRKIINLQIEIRIKK